MTFVGLFQEIKKVYGFCPCCDAPFRLSDVTLFTRKAPPSTAFDLLEAARERLDAATERFEISEEKIRERSRTLGQKAASERLAKLLPFFTSRKVSPRDVKVLFHPVDYIAFCGVSQGQCLSVDFVDRPADSKSREIIHESIDDSIRHSRVEWQTYRISRDGTVTSEIGRKGRRTQTRSRRIKG